MHIIYKKSITLILLTFLFFLTNSYSYQTNEKTHPMFTSQKELSIESTIDELASTAKDPNAASLPLMASAGLGDAKRYAHTCQAMFAALADLDKEPTKYPAWMRTDSFKAWMWGRVLLAADNMADAKTIYLSKNKLSSLLNKKMTTADSLAFYTWALAYDATLNVKEHQKFKKIMFNNAMSLSEKSKDNPKDHDALSDALWAWVMNLSAAAKANDKRTYAMIKEQMTLLTGKESVTQALLAGLLRTAKSNDYPAWALGKVSVAAKTMNDEALYEEVTPALHSSIVGANQAKANAEYILAVIESKLSSRQNTPRAKL